MTEFDPTKPVQTRDGKPARILCTDAKGGYPIVALITNGNDEDVDIYTLKGKVAEYCDKSSGDLVNIPEKRFVNIWERDGRCHVSYTPYATAEEAKNVTETFTNTNYYVAVAVEVEV